MTFLPMKALLIVLLLIKMQPMNDIKTNAESCFDLSGYLIMYDLTLSQLFNGSIFKLNEYYFFKKTFALQIEAVDDVLNQQQIRLYEEKVRRLLMR